MCIRDRVFVLPDFLANAGGVTVSYFEQVQNAYNFYWPLQEVHERLDEKMSRAFHGIYQMYLQEKVNMRQAAYLVSVARVSEACKLVFLVSHACRISYAILASQKLRLFSESQH